MLYLTQRMSLENIYVKMIGYDWVTLTKFDENTMKIPGPARNDANDACVRRPLCVVQYSSVPM